MFQRRFKETIRRHLRFMMWPTYAARLDPRDKDEHELIFVYDTADPEDRGCCQGDQGSKRGVDKPNSGHEQ